MRFNQKLAALAFATSTVVASFGAQASSIDVKVSGTITPAACTPSLAGGGEIAYGKIATSLVENDKFVALPEHELSFTINCDVPTKVALKAIDNRVSSMVPGATLGLYAQPSDSYNFGLGSVNGKNTGGYVMRAKQDTFTADGTNVKTLVSVNSGTSWSTGGGTIPKGSASLISWSQTAGTGPIAFKSLAGTFGVQAVLNKGSELSLVNDVDLDGSATIELVYL